MSPTAIAITKAMSLAESGGNFTTQGKSNEYGALQYTPNTWKCASKKATGEILVHNQANEWYVSVLTVQRLLNSNPDYTAYDIGMIWNGSLCGSEKPIAKKGKNKYGVYYNTVTHAEKVLKNYYQVNAEQ